MKRDDTSLETKIYQTVSENHVGEFCQNLQKKNNSPATSKVPE